MTDGSPASSVLVHDGPHLQALVRKGSSPFVLVTFNSRGFLADGRTIWGQPLAEKLDLNAVGFVTKKPNWFPGNDFAKAINAVRPFLRPFAERIGYGYSQGAYAAIRASRPLKLSATIAVSPQWSIDPADIVDARYNKFFARRANAQMSLKGSDAPKRLFVLADSGYEEDRNHLERIMAAMPKAELIPMPASDHGTISVLRGTATFSAMLEAVRSGAPLAPVIARLRRASPVRREVLIRRALMRKQGARAHGIFSGAELDTESAATMISRFVRWGEAERVITDARRLHNRNPDDGFVKAVLAYAIATVGMERAQVLAEEAEALRKTRAVLRLTRTVRRGASAMAKKDGEDEEEDQA